MSVLRNKHQAIVLTYQLCVIQRNNHTQITDTQTGNEPTSENIASVFRTSLDDHSDAEDDHGDNDSLATAQSIGEITVQQCTNPRSQFQDGCKHTLLKTSSSCISVGLYMLA